MVHGTLHSQVLEVGNEGGRWALVDALTTPQEVQLQGTLKEQRYAFQTKLKVQVIISQVLFLWTKFQFKGFFSLHFLHKIPNKLQQFTLTKTVFDLLHITTMYTHN